MAKKDEYKYEPVTAQEALAPHGDGGVDADAAERAAKAGVVDAADIDYTKALQNYEQRSDVETLEHRRAREAGTEFSDAAFRRTVEGVTEENEDGGVITAAKATPEAPARKKA